MKLNRLIYIFILLSSCRAIGQDTITSVFHLTKIPAEGLQLDKGWKFKAGDNPEWSKQEYDDKEWAYINPTHELHHLPVVREAGIGWFRLNLQVDSSLLGERTTMVVSNMGASEIYLNGELIYKFGFVSRDYKKEQTQFFLNRLVTLKLGKESSQTLAIRYSFNKRNLYLKFIAPRSLVRMVLKESNQGFDDRIREESFNTTLRSMQASFYLTLVFLLLFLFFSYRLQREYLYSGIYFLCVVLGSVLRSFAFSGTTTVTWSNSLLLTWQALTVLGGLAFINFTYILYKQKRSWFYYIIVLYSLVTIPLYFVSYDYSGFFTAFFFPVANIDFFRLNLQAIRRRRPGAWILLATSILLFIVLFWYIWSGFMGKTLLGTLLQGIAVFIPGIGFSLLITGEFARTGSALQARVIEVEQLSEKMIAKEIEKQEILGAQNETLEKQVTERTEALSKSLRDLKETQQQLIQHEKMASLGELTAGIAHEIQNPLNFVNNFSGVSTELVDEMNAEIDKGNTDDAKLIAQDLKQNLEKINHHGKRAGDIVKGMLQHSRSSSGQKELTDISALAEEYVRLAYHGLKAKDKSFTPVMKTDFDSSVVKINIMPQDIGRVILNLINNAFYAVTEKQKQNTVGYEPLVSVSTKKLKDKIEIHVKDNGTGIPQKVLDKIFQPFFTTKPTGQGTGLGLSLSYDIVKAHGGELKVETKEGEGSIFTISLNT